MLLITECMYIFLVLFINNAELIKINDIISEIIPEHAKKGFIYLVNSNLTFDFPTIRFYKKNGMVWIHPGKAHVMPSLYIIELSEEDDLEDILIELHRHMLFEPRATYILVTEKTDDESLLNSLKSFYISDALAVAPNLMIYHFNRNLIKMIPIHKHDIIFQEPTKLWLTNTTNITIRAGVIKKPPFVICPECATDKGIEIELFDLASNYMNINVEYTEVRSTYWGDKFSGTYTHLYKELFDRNFDVIFGQTFDFDDCHYDFDLSPIHIIDPVQFVVPKAKIIKQYNLSNYIFRRETLMAFIVVLVLVFLTICILNRWKNKTDNIFELLQVMFEIPINIQRIKIIPLRLLYAFFIFSTIILNTGLKSKLFWAVTMDHFEYQIDSLEDIVHSDLVPVFNNRTGGYFDRNDPIDKFMDTKSPRTCDFDFSCVDIVAFDRNITTMKLKKSLEYYTPRRYVDDTGKALVHIINFDVQKLYFRFFFIKGHPAFSRFSKIVRTLMENGIKSYLSYKLEEDNRRAQVKARMNYHSISVQKLDIIQLSNIFYVYISGIILSSVIFCIEYMWHRFRNRNVIYQA